MKNICVRQASKLISFAFIQNMPSMRGTVTLTKHMSTADSMARRRNMGLWRHFSVWMIHTMVALLMIAVTNIKRKGTENQTMGSFQARYSSQNKYQRLRNRVVASGHP